MIQVNGVFTENETRVILSVMECLTSHFGNMELDGMVARYSDELIECKVYVGMNDLYPKIENIFTLRFGVRDSEDISSGKCNYIHIPSIVVPVECRGQYLGTELLLAIARVAYELKLGFFVTSLSNERFTTYLLSLGGVADASGDIELEYPIMICKVKQRMEEDYV